MPQWMEQLNQGLKDLHLPTVRLCYGEQAELARQERLSYEQYLWELVQREQEERRHRRIARLRREARLPLEKSLATFDRQRLPAKVDAQVSVLVEGSFLDRAENVLAFGNPGSGKTQPNNYPPQSARWPRNDRDGHRSPTSTLWPVVPGQRHNQSSRLRTLLCRVDVHWSATTHSHHRDPLLPSRA